MSFNPAAVKIMGILNATPDSFFIPSRTDISREGKGRIDAMISAGADIIDIGGESSRPGAQYIEADEELRRIIPLIRYIRGISDIPISVDTRKARVAEEALAAGADIINDISSFEDDSDMPQVAVKYDCSVVLMHKKGTPETMQIAPRYNDPVEEVYSYLEERIEYACSKGLKKENLIIDPGFGFGKRHEDNLALMADLRQFKKLGCRILIGVSRKSIIGKILDNSVDERLNGTVIINTIGVMAGADIIRVHDVPEHVELQKIMEALFSKGAGNGAS